LPLIYFYQHIYFCPMSAKNGASRNGKKSTSSTGTTADHSDGALPGRDKTDGGRSGDRTHVRDLAQDRLAHDQARDRHEHFPEPKISSFSALFTYYSYALAILVSIHHPVINQSLSVVSNAGFTFRISDWPST
jgi:hypothetical protein